MSVRPIKVAVFNRNFFRSAGGAESYSVSVAEGLAAHTDAAGAHDFEVHVWCQQADRTDPRITYHTVPVGSRRRWINQIWYATYTWWHTRRGYDIVHSHENTWHGNVQTAHVRPVRQHQLAGLSGAKRALRWLKIVTNPRLLFYVWVEAARHAPQKGRVVVAVSEAMRRETLVAFPKCDPNMPIIPPGVGTPNLQLAPREARQKLGVPIDRALMLFCGNDYGRKGLPAIMQAMKLQPSLPNLLVVGDPNQIPKFKEQAEQLGVEDRVHFLGRCSDMALAYRSADILVHPTLDDSFAMVVLEAMSYGLPVVVSGPSYCGISALLRDGKEAVLLDDPRDAQALAQAITEVLSSEELRGTLAQHGRTFAAERNWSKSVELYAELFKQMCSRKAEPLRTNQVANGR